MDSKDEEFFIKLKESLIETTSFPTDYMFKFIIPNQAEQKQQLEAMFNLPGIVIKTNLSKSGKFISFTAVLKLKSADEVISKYKEAAQVKGIISL